MGDPTGATDTHSLSRPTPTAVPEPEPPGEACLLWHKRDLRLADHAALAAATAEYETVVPVFVFDPYFYSDRSLACDARIQFLHESLQDLDRQYRSVTGTGISYLHAKPTEILPAFTERGWDIVTMAPPTGRYGLERREQLQQSCGDRIRLVSGDGLRRDVADPRDGWQEQMQDWFESDRHDHDLAGTTVDAVETGVTLARVTKTHDVSPSKTNIPVGGTDRGNEKLTAFLDRIEQYPGNISAPLDARTGTASSRRISGLAVSRSGRCIRSSRPTRRTVAEKRCFGHACTGTNTTARSCSTGPPGPTPPSTR
jgi:Deoxyribodipyrimidine photolyase